MSSVLGERERGIRDVANRADSQAEFIRSLLAEAGVAVDGSAACDPRVHDARFFGRVLAGGSLGLGEAYMDGWWDCDALDAFFYRVLSADLQKRIRSLRALPLLLKSILFDPGRRAKAFEIGERHYDIGNDLFAVMLDRRMNYSCGYWEDAATLDEAQEAKLDLVCRKLCLAPGMRVLDIGCGWGSLAIWAAERYGVSVVGITVSREQLELARERARGLPVELRLEDYRDLNGRFDAVVSIGMFEHVGFRNYRAFFDVARRCLSDSGLFLLHTIGSNESRRVCDLWIGRYIFPNSLVPSLGQITAALEGRFVVEDVHSFGPFYDPTLMAWCANFEAAWPHLLERYGERFGRMWRYYLLSCAGSFRARYNQLWQIVLSKRGFRGGYRPAR